MRISKRLGDALTAFGNSNIINRENSMRALLGAAANEAELMKFIDENADDADFKAELTALKKTGAYNAESRISLPFIFSLLYLIDAKKLKINEIAAFAKPKSDIVVAYKAFATLTRETIEKAIAEI